MGKEKVVPPEEHPGTKKLLGTFSAFPPMCIGEPYLTGGINAKRGERLMGKQFTSGALRHEKSNIAPGTFSAPVLLWSEQKDPYADNINARYHPGDLNAKLNLLAEYKDVYPPDRKKAGFGTSDYPKRDEFSNTIRTAQLREILKKEVKATKRAKSAIEKRSAAFHAGNQVLGNTGGEAEPFDGKIPAPPLFDVIYRIPEASLRLARDDRQAANWYKSERRKLERGEPLRQVKPTVTEPSWVSVAVAGKSYNVLVDTNGSVLAKKEVISVAKQVDIL